MKKFITVRILDITSGGSKKKIINTNLISEVLLLNDNQLSILMNNTRTHTVFIDDNPVLKKFHSDLIKEI